MIIQNGTIRIYSIESEGFDENGNPIKPAEILSETIPCNWKRNSYEKRGVYEDGVFTSASYIILLDAKEFVPCRIRLFDSKGNALGDYQVRRKGITYLDFVCCIELIV